MPGGRPSQPTKLKVLKGVTKPSRVNQHEPIPRPVGPTAPEGTPEPVLIEWRRVLVELEAMGLAHAADRDVIYAYCCAVVEHRGAYEALTEHGPLIPGRAGGMVRNPAAQMVRDSATNLRMLARELGLTPSARASLKLGERDERDHASRILG